MKVANQTSSTITLPSGHRILPHQVKAMPPEIILHADNKVLVGQLQKHGKLIIEATEDTPEQVRARQAVALEAEMRREKALERVQAREAATPANNAKKSLSAARRESEAMIPKNPTREEVCFASRDALLTCAYENEIDVSSFRGANEEDIRLLLGAVLFNDPGLRRIPE